MLAEAVSECSTIIPAFLPRAVHIATERVNIHAYVGSGRTVGRIAKGFLADVEQIGGEREWLEHRVNTVRVKRIMLHVHAARIVQDGVCQK